MKRICFLFVLCLICSLANAEEVEIEGINYRLFDGNKAEVISKSGGYIGDIVIPSTITVGTTDYNVIQIRQEAFGYNRELTSISIPNSISLIGANAFRDCSMLSAVYINDLKAWCNILFEGSIYGWTNPLSYAHHLFLNGEEIKELIIPEGVTTINAYSFYGMSELTSIYFPSSVVEVGSLAFEKCNNISKIIINDIGAWCNIKFTKSAWTGAISNPLSVARHLYLNEEEIKDLIIPGEIADINNYVFQGCKSIESITFHDGVKSIGINAFSGCSNVEKLDLPSSLTSIKDGAFQGLNLVKELNIPEGVTSIGNIAFSGLTSLTSITWPTSLESIGDNSFSRCINITALNIPDNVTTIGEGAFNSCEGLVTINLPNNLSRISSYLVCDCYNLISIDIPESVTSIGNYAFQNCRSLTSVKIPQKVESIGEYAFYECSSLVTVDMSEVENLKRIWHHAFQNCTKMNTLYFPKKLIDINNFVFANCRSLTSLDFPENLEGIGEYAFEGCNGITTVEIPNSVIAINEAAFANCKSLEKITIPKSLRTIPNGIIANCTSIKDVYCLNDAVPATNPNAFAQSLVCKATLHVPEESIEIYKSRDPWNYFKEIVSLEASSVNSVIIENIKNSAWYDLNGNKLGGEPNSKGIYINNGKKVLK